MHYEKISPKSYHSYFLELLKMPSIEVRYLERSVVKVNVQKNLNKIISTV